MNKLSIQPSAKTSMEAPLIILNALNQKHVLPAHFRRCDQEVYPCSKEQVSLEGLSQLKISGSAQFSIEGLQAIKAKLCSRPLIIMDLRQESHGFLNGIAISLFIPENRINAGRTEKEIKKREKEWLKQLVKHPTLMVFEIEDMADGRIKSCFPLLVTPRIVENEEEVCKREKLSYNRLPALDHTRITDEQVNTFLSFVRSVSSDTWIHFHCKAGKGRTTMFMCMYDMLFNAKKVSFEDILNRQWMIGGSHLLKSLFPKIWRDPLFDQRREFLRAFYHFCKEPDPLTATWPLKSLSENSQEI